MTPHHPPATARVSGRREWTAIRTLLPYLWPKGERGLRARVVLALFCLLLAKLATVWVPILYKRAVDVLAPEAPGAAIAVPVALIVGYGIVRILSAAFAELRDALFAKVGQRAIRRVGLETFRHLHRLSLRFHLDRRTGGVARVIERGTGAIEFLLSFMLFNILPTLLEIALVTAILWGMFSISYAAVTLVTIVLYVGFTIAVTEWRTKFVREMNEIDTEASARSVDALLNYETVKYFGNESYEAERYDRSLQAYERAAVRTKTTLSFLNIGQGLVIAIGLTFLMLMAARGVAAGELTIGDFVLVNTYLIQLYQPLNFLGFVYRQIRQSLVDMEAMFALLEEGVEVADTDGAPPLDVSRGEIVFDGVSFSYNPDRSILEDVSFAVPAGKRVAIVGPSGAGKSTISRLLFRYYDVTGGAIRVDGQDVREVAQESLRAAIGIVPQDTVLFNDTIYHNVAYGRPAATPAEVERAARAARIHDFVASLPEGYETKVGERGLKLSGGEKQRVAIARTILKDPPILMFDEATSSLDTRTEKEIQASLDEIARGRTTLVIAHRLSTVVDADEILVLDGGRIVERGRHDALVDSGGVYAAMWRRQQEAAEREAARRADGGAGPEADGGARPEADGGPGGADRESEGAPRP
ncbi:MAG TPA: ABC transporter ATP-binding protein/permease [Gemmatimonadota bacterium]|nr:ABC transporter ATP-binding protein/permease [Gemmatimonadota bacterium]